MKLIDTKKILKKSIKKLDFKEYKLTKIHYKEIKKESIIFDPIVRTFCSRKYPGHSKGCMNIEKCNELKIPSIDKLIEEINPKYYYLIYVLFDFKKYRILRKEQNPEFFKTIRREKNLLYWQNTIRKEIQGYLEELFNENKKIFYVLGCGSGLNLSFQNKVGSMENSCIYVFSTLKKNHIKFELKPETRIILCNLILSKFELKFNKKKSKITDYIKN